MLICIGNDTSNKQLFSVQAFAFEYIQIMNFKLTKSCVTAYFLLPTLDQFHKVPVSNTLELAVEAYAQAFSKNPWIG